MIRSYKYFAHTGTYVFSLTNVKISFKILIGGKSILYMRVKCQSPDITERAALLHRTWKPILLDYIISS
jgi:hypothetical protein